MTRPGLMELPTASSALIAPPLSVPSTVPTRGKGSLSTESLKYDAPPATRT